MNTYGLDAYAANLHILRFADEFANRYVWQSERQRGIFVVTVQNVIRMPEKAGKYAEDFCSESGMARQQFDQLISNMFHGWSERVEQLKKRDS